MIRAVLDANIFVSAVLSPQGNPARILKAWKADAFNLLLSEPILQEIDRSLRYPKIVKRHGWNAKQIDLFVGDLAYFSILVGDTPALAVIAEDPSDNKYLECAVAGSAEYIVSGDEHLLRLDEYQGIRILTPRVFLDVLDIQTG